jgi:hypothetical protein
VQEESKLHQIAIFIYLYNGVHPHFTLPNTLILRWYRQHDRATGIPQEFPFAVLGPIMKKALSQKSQSTTRTIIRFNVWLRCYQAYRMDYVKGEDYPIANSCSRLCAILSAINQYRRIQYSQLGHFGTCICFLGPALEEPQMQVLYPPVVFRILAFASWDLH